MRRSSLIHYVNAVCFLFLLSGCDDGWKNIGDDIQIKLFPMGDCSPNVREAQYLLVETRYHINKPPIIDSKGTYTIYSHNLKTEVILPWEDSIHWRIKNQLLAMNCGDAIHINCPLHAVNKTFLCAYQELPEERDEDYVEIQLNILKTFTEQGFHDYLISCAQHDEIPEVEAIDFF